MDHYICIVKGKKNKNLSLPAKQASGIQLNKELNGEAISKAFQKAPFFKKKMKRGTKMISVLQPQPRQEIMNP